MNRIPLFLRVLLFTLFVPGSVTVWIPFFLLRLGGAFSSAGFPGGLGIVLVGVGVAVYAWCAWDFAQRGKGTPGPWDAPKRLVIKGLYRFTRNPMYVGVCAILIGEALLVPSAARLAYAIVVWLGFNVFIFVFEEPSLRRQFGKQYSEYCRRVGRWV